MSTEEKILSAASLRSWIDEGHKIQARNLPAGSASVLIPILIRDGACHVLYEVRAAKLHTQPGEICFPGGRIEPGELPLEAAVREAKEELCIREDQIEIVGELETTTGPGGIPFYSYVGILSGYEGSWSGDEVERVFTIPLEWIIEHDPEIYRILLERRFPDDFPYEYVPGGTDYHWRKQYHTVPFYPDAIEREGDEPMLWGMTARVTYAFAQLLRVGKSAEKIGGKGAEKLAGKGAEKIGGKGAEKIGRKSAEKLAGKNAEKEE